MSDKTDRVFKAIEKVEKVRFNCRLFGTFLFLFSLGLAMHARSTSLELKLPVGLLDSGLHNGYTLIFGPVAILVVAIAAFFQRSSFLSLQKDARQDVEDEQLAHDLTSVEQAELSGRQGVFTWLSDVGPFLAAAFFASTITWVFGDFQYPYAKVSDHPNLEKALGGEKPEFVNVFEPYKFKAQNSTPAQLSIKEIHSLIGWNEATTINRKDNWGLLFFGPDSGFKIPYSPYHERINKNNYATTPSIDCWQAIGHLFATVVTCLIAIWVTVPLKIRESIANLKQRIGQDTRLGKRRGQS